MAPPRLRLSEGVSTVVIAEWTPVEGADRTWIEFGPDTAYGSTAPERMSGEAILLGMREDTVVHARVAVQEGEAVSWSEDVTITTGALLGGLPDLTEGADAGAAFGNWFVVGLTDLGEGEGAMARVAVFERDGPFVWATPAIPGNILAARPTRDGAGVVYLWDETVTRTDTAEICSVNWDGEEVSCVSTPGATHDFVELEDGSYVFGEDIVHTWKGYTLKGSGLGRITPDGVRTRIWDAWDEITPVPLGSWPEPGGAETVDWTHLNGLWFDEPADTFYVSLWWLLEIRKIPVATGRSEWILGGQGNQFLFKGSEFGPQHAPQLIDGGILLFDNRYQADASRLAAYALDEPGRIATQTLDIPHPTGGHANAMGDAHLLPNGYYAASFGDAGDLFVFTAEGEVAWARTPPDGLLIPQMYVYDDLYDMRPN